MTTVRIPVRNRTGVVAYALVDVDDVERVRAHRWTLGTGGYVKTSLHESGKPQRTVRLHRLITGANAGLVVDHINHDPLDNRRSNLRICKHADNVHNRKPTHGRALPKGVHRVHRRWHARIRVNDHLRYLGSFTTIQAASAAYQRAARALFGEFAYRAKEIA